ncbi:Peroxidase, family 2-domain-containing protein [Mycena epipterygia]|nr:Peroxidase, family 2-domain-containing protein [Mycena epipterygia]
MQLKISCLVLASVFFAAKVGAWQDLDTHNHKFARWTDPYNHKFIAPTATDQRSPCPGLNTLANHGYLPRNGRDITVPHIMNASIEGFGLNFDNIIVAAKFGLLSNDTADTFDTMNLGALSLHNLIEHDASISRNDWGPDGTGDNVHFNETVFSTLANSNPGKDYYDTTAVGQMQKERLAHSIATNPALVNTEKEFHLRSAESSFYLSIFGNFSTGIAPKEYVNIFFREERLPIAEGWKKPALITSAMLAPIRSLIQTASEWNATQPCGPLVLSPHITFNAPLANKCML